MEKTYATVGLNLPATQYIRLENASRALGKSTDEWAGFLLSQWVDATRRRNVKGNAKGKETAR